MLFEEIRRIADYHKGEIKESKGVYTLECIVAERKTFLSRKKLIYQAKFRIDDAKKEVRFTEMLKESGFGVSSDSDSDISSGFGFKKETYKTGTGPSEGSIAEQSNLFGKHYIYSFDFSLIRKNIQVSSEKYGYSFHYFITGAGL